MSLSSGTRLGTYQILSPLGAGGMGEVYRARDTRLGREVAIKVLPAAVAASPDRLARFEREARTVAGLSHPNIVTLFSVEDEDGIRFLTMELVEGQSLDRLVAPGGLPLARLLDVALPLANALDAAHERGVVHRDLKPGNVMVTRDGWVKVLDFGLAKIAAGEVPAGDATIGVTAQAPISGKGEVFGTVPYMAPEQIRGESVDARSDIFALGILLYELATGRRPFVGASSADVSSAILRDTPAPVLSIRADLPRDLERIVGRCLEKSPRDRFQTARDVYNELRYVKREIERMASSTPSAPAAAPAGPPASGTSPPSWPTPPSLPSPFPLPSGTSAPVSSGGSRAARDVASIAVLPFVNRSRGEEDEYFSDGLADELLNVLTKIRGLRVAARASSFQFKGKNEDLASIGEKLNVATLLDGSVRKSGNRVRISVQLVKAADRIQLWSETYDRSLDDIFAVQDDIAQSVVKELRATLLGNEPDSDASRRAQADVAVVAKGHGSVPEAHRLYLQGKYFLDQFSQDGTRRGVEYLEQATRLDPSHASAWAELGRAHITLGAYGWEPVDPSFAKAREYVTRALQVAPDLAEAHARLSAIQRTYDWDMAAAEASLRRALELAPSSAVVLGSAAELANILGRTEEAEATIRRAIEQDPLSARGYGSLGLILRSADRLAEAEQAYRKGLELAPNRIGGRNILGILIAEQGRLDEGLAVIQSEAAEWARLTGLAAVHHLAGRQAESDEALRALKEKYPKESGYQIAAAHAVRGEVDEAFQWLEHSYRERDSGLNLVKTERVFRILHGDPRWAPLLKKLGLGD